ncbi:MAG: hypothetical protein ACTHMM_19730 [Agriterribacter sp.]
MKRRTAILFTALLITVCGKAQTVINPKGSKVSLDTSKWTLSGNNIYNKNSGNVGIGTAAPVAALHVYNGDFRLENENNWNGYKGVTYSNTQYPQLFLFKARGTKASPLYPQSGNTMGVFKVANAVDSTGGAGFRVNATETQTSSAHGSSITVFTTANGTNSNKDVFLIDHDGEVGIGTASPTAPLHVNTDAAATYLRVANFLAPGNTTAGNSSVISLGVESTSKNEAQLRYVHQASGSDNNRLDFGWNGISAPSMSLLAGGNVGIGTAAPAWLLDVQGSNAIGQFKRINGDFASLAPGVLFARSRGSVGAEANIAAGDVLGKIQFRGRLGGSDTDYGALIYKADGTVAGNGHYAFTGSDLATEVMTIRSNDGRVGIGTTSPNSTLHVAGSMAANITTVSGNITLDETHSYVVLSSANVTIAITLPAASSCPGREYHIKRPGTTGTKTISAYLNTSGTSTTSLPNNSAVHLVSDGTNWQQF